ncbi:UDP-glucose dehydrogenase family protein [Limnohabitans planktonicus]|uniref:UDP-glucose 6-dehydrogenase n=1 Tax=Limnohabitans planktonicus II-D5 TaxID=1293045 RepID=A0A2T7UBN0_9BURK|nr:UDP-glucose/GDP-mannose dehydrogenase family protein [Limnohabitans planktonicus]PVE42116.1 UDP-glucose 6-dehydrogenase [Limnohabitans planktonicus II-D5]|eukprot:gene24762-31139_t
MRITIIGSGYVGLVTGACLSDLGFKVVCLDKDEQKIRALQEGEVPIYEPGLKELLARNRADGRIRFTTDACEAIEQGDVLFIAVGTPPAEDGSADLGHVLSVASMIGRHLKSFKLVVNKSTVPVGTADKVRMAIAHELAHRGMPTHVFDVISNPEFLKEGAAIDDFMRPDRIVVGVDEGIHKAKSQRMMSDLYASFNRHHSRTVWMDVRSAELTKYAANAMLAARISFMNEIANLADALGADVDHIRRGIGADNRIGYSFLYAGCGYGGSCFPKDTQALVQTAKAHGQDMSVVSATEQVNARQKMLLVERLIARMGPDLTGRKIAVWGLAFKPNTDDMREAPSRVVIRSLLERGARVRAYDPVAGQEAMKALQDDCVGQDHLLKAFELAVNEMQALDGADALLILTEWKNFHNPDFEGIKALMRHPYILDGRNLYNPQALFEWGIAYQGVGRRNALCQSLSFDRPNEPVLSVSMDEESLMAHA